MTFFTRDKRPKNEFFIFKKPMAAKGREITLLGCAFENPQAGTQEAYTPQGPQTAIASVPQQQTKQADDSKGDKGTTTEPDSGQETTQASASNQIPPPQLQPTTAKLSYNTPGKWPKDLFRELSSAGLYPNEPTVATGVEAITETIKDSETRNVILSAISFALRIKKSDVDTVVIPVFRRHSMEDRRGKIDALLHNKEYREKLIDLFDRQKNHKILFIATDLIACGGLSYNRIKEVEQALEGDVKDPTNTVPIKIGGQIHRVKHSTLKGTYETDVVLCMSYRRVKYEWFPDDNRGYLGKLFYKDPKQNQYDKFAIVFDGKKGENEGVKGQHVFWVEPFETEGQAPAWMGATNSSDESLDVTETANQVRGLAIFDDARNNDVSSGAEQSEEDYYPADFFNKSDELSGQEEFPPNFFNKG